MAFGRFGSVGAGFGRLGGGVGGALAPVLVPLDAPTGMTPAGKTTWNSGTGVLSVVGALAAEAVGASFTPLAIAGRNYRVTFTVGTIAGDSFSFRTGNTLAGQISGTGAKSIDLAAGAATPVFVLIEWGGTLTDLTLSNIKVYLLP